MNNFSPGDPYCEINFGKSLKIARSFCANFFKDHLNQAICYLASLKVYTSKVNSWKTFFNSTKWLKAYKTGYPFFIKTVLKPERAACSKCQHCSSIKMTSLKLAESGQFFFHANYRIPVCETTTKYFWWNWLPVHVNMSWASGLKWFWMKQFFTVAVLFLVTKCFCKFPMWRIIITHPC